MGLIDTNMCPGCGANLEGELIPEACLHFYNLGPNGEMIHSDVEYAEVRDQIKNEKTHYSRVIGVEYADGNYDGVSEWRCPNCGLREGRFSGKILRGDEVEEAPYGR